MNIDPRAPVGASPSLRVVVVVATVWIAAALALGFLGAFPRAPFLAPLSVLLGSVALIGAGRRAGPARTARLTTRAVLVGQSLRAPIGALFLVELERGNLPATFAVRAGWGDIAAGVGALALALSIRGGREPRRALAIAWGLFGLVDILLVAGTAAFLAIGRRDPLLLAAFDRFPYGLLPTVVVPLVISTHVLLLARALRGRSREVAARAAST